MVSEARPRADGDMPASPWSITSVTIAVVAGAVALTGLYVRGSELSISALFPPMVQQSPSPNQAEVYCYESVMTLQESPPAPPGQYCFRIENGKFTSVVSREDSDAAVAAAAEHPLPGHVIPGLWDGHGHLIGYGEFLASVDLFGSSDAADVRHRLRTYLAAHPDVGGHDKWVRGFGWDQMAMGGMPSADLLDDEVLCDLYIMLDRVDGHCIWVSRVVLELLPSDLVDMPGGEIVREPGLGVFCDNAMNLVLNQWPRPGRDTKAEYVRLAMREMTSMGLVGMHDAGAPPDDLRLLQALAGDMEPAVGWTMRVYAMVECAERNTFCPEDVAQLRQERSDLLTIRSVKLYADGALGSWGSAMIDPYSDRPDTRGSLLVDAATLTRVTRDWAAAGFQVNIHAIGDLANRNAVDAFETALVDLCPARPPAECQHDRFRFRIEHAQIVHPHDQARIHVLGLVPSIQPTHATSDMAYAERRLGPERTRLEAYRMRSFLHNKLIPVLGSDVPIEPPDPFQGIYAAVTRRSPQTGKGVDGTTQPWHPEEALTLDEALEGFTKGAAYGAFLEGRAGVIQAGAFADWVVLDKPLGDYDVEDLRSMKVRETWVAGKRVYERDKSTASAL